MLQDKIGVKVVTCIDNAVGVIESDEGIDVFQVDDTYKCCKELLHTIPVVVYTTPTYIDQLGNAKTSIPVKGLRPPAPPPPPPPKGITWDNETTWDNGTYWSQA